MRKRSPVAPEAPLLACADARQQADAARRRQVQRGAVLALGMALLGATIVVPPAPRLVWNASPSAPIGLYAVTPGARPEIGDMVIAWLPAPSRALAAARHYLPRNVPLVKHVAAARGDKICAFGVTIFINGGPVTRRRSVDHAGRAMPWWIGCRRLTEGEFLLLMTANSNSFDGRYFGPSERTEIVGTARLVWPVR